jgi:diacylglycerol O-acyltransferase / wax synthase
VPGPDKPLYFRGAELVATYPASIVTHGQALNITCQSYAGSMNFGFTGCHSSVPRLQRLAVYAADAVEELEAAILPAATPARTATRPRSKTKASAGQPRRARAANAQPAKPRGAATGAATPPAAARPRKRARARA